MLEHGGRLRQAAAQYGIPLANWIDLSTGINPRAYPIPPLDPECWLRLPEDDDGLDAIAAEYYGNSNLLALPGSQAAIQTLPTLFQKAAVACVSPVYAEHPHAWEKSGHRLRRLPSLTRALSAITPYVQLCNPNNPTATHYSADQLIEAAHALHRRGGWLIVDEAFADATPDNTITHLAGSDTAPNLIVLRSLGKFFGLAGARVGFVFGQAEKLNQLREILGPWPLAHPSRAVAKLALNDTKWQETTREQLRTDSNRLKEILTPLGIIHRTELFCTLDLNNKPEPEKAVTALCEHFAQYAILTRRFDEYGLIRFGLPGKESDWQALETSIQNWLTSQ